MPSAPPPPPPGPRHGYPPPPAPAPAPAAPNGPWSVPPTTTEPLGGPASGGRVWLGGLVDQLVVVGWALGWLAAALALPDSLVVAGLLVAVVGALVVLLVECLWLRARGTTTGLWVVGVRVHPRERVDLESALEHYMEFWVATALAPLAWVLGRVLGPSSARGFVVHDLRTRRAPARVLRTLTVLVVLAAPAALVVVFAG